MLKSLSLGIALTGLAVCAPLAAIAQGNNCAPRDVITTKLTDKYSEVLTGGGMQNAKTVLEVWTSEKTGSFTVLVTYANGMSCIVSSGHNWSAVAVAMEPKGTAS